MAVAAPYPNLFGWSFVPVDKPHSQWGNVKDATFHKAPHLPWISDVDRWVNRNVRYVRDAADHWQTPEATWERKAGDCEDIAILKRAILLAQGRRDDDMLLVIAHDLIARNDHAFLVVDGCVLDSFNALTLPVSKVKDYRPIMAMTGSQSWLFGRAG